MARLALKNYKYYITNTQILQMLSQSSLSKKIVYVCKEIVRDSKYYLRLTVDKSSRVGYTNKTLNICREGYDLSRLASSQRRLNILIFLPNLR